MVDDGFLSNASEKNSGEFNGLITIDLSALAHNWRYLNSRLTKGCRLGAVVKADAYGLGVRPIVETLLPLGCKVFFVSNLSEAIALRAFVPVACEIMVFSGCAQGFEKEFVRYSLTPILTSLSMLRRWVSTGLGVEQSSVLKIDTGMGRYGVSLDELSYLLESIDVKAHRVDTLMSHFACSEQVGHALNARQLVRFNDAFKAYKSVHCGGRASLANSSAILTMPKSHYDLARSGFALYGGAPLSSDASQRFDILPVVSVSLPVVQVRSLKKGDTVGYGATFSAQADMVVATVYGGYADGIFRSAGERVGLVWRGVDVPVIGRVSMDSIAVDLSLCEGVGLPGEGDRLSLLGEGRSIEMLANMIGTIGYEVLTSLSVRYERQYIGLNDSMGFEYE